MMYTYNTLPVLVVMGAGVQVPTLVWKLKELYTQTYVGM